MDNLLTQLEQAQDELTPEFKALRTTMSALKTAIKLAQADKPDAIPMQKALQKLETAAEPIDNTTLTTAIAQFRTVTNEALNNLAFDFAKDLKKAFEEQGIKVTGRPPTLTIDILTLKIDIAARKGQWFYGQEPLTRPLPLSTNHILKAYHAQQKRIGDRDLNPSAFLQEIYNAWTTCINKRSRRPTEGRINIIEIYSQIILDRQTNRFWNAPARKTFKDYDRELFVRDLVLLHQSGHTTLNTPEGSQTLRLGVATKSQTEQSSRSIYLPDVGSSNYYSDISFQ
ncbi:MAG TPA: hypothetical protein VLL52_25505 [Anaerolineae bacterium]|nr:hypothetical protein [Anaerolineae bacterium]